MKYFYVERQKVFNNLANLRLCLLMLLFATASTTVVNAQILTDFPCYAVSEDNGAPNVLFVYDPVGNQWNEVGVTGGTLIESIATDPVTDIIYAVDAGQFGTIDATTGVFTALGPGVGSVLANGDLGPIALDDIDGLTYDPINMVMYASHRIGSTGPGTNDLLFQIDPSTGLFIPGVMEDSAGNPADYAVVPEVFDGSFGGDVYDVDDIAYNPYTGQLFAIQNQDGPGTITELNPVNGSVESVILDISDDDVEGLGFTYLGELYATTGDNGSTQVQSNSFIFINLGAGTTQVLNPIDPDDGIAPAPGFPGGEEVDFESFDCLTAFNDLALDKLLDPNSPTIVYPGDNVTFNVTVYNQGDFANSDITLTDYIPAGLILNDATWTDLGNGTATTTIPGPLAANPGGAPPSVTVPITFTVDPSFTGTSITNTAEITSSFNPDITALNGSPLPLPDIDSNPDDQDDEINVVDNEITGGGPNANEDEDDHDIAPLTVEIFDLALTKQLAAGQTTPVFAGNDVTFTIEVTNQGTVDAQNINIVDYIPAGFSLSANDGNGWAPAAAAGPGQVTATLPGTVASGTSATIDIVLTVDPSQAAGTNLVNDAEIASAEDINGNTPPDVDSTPDQTQGNDAGGLEETGSDNSIDGDGTGQPDDQDPATDEDDNDPALVPVERFDLALNKVLVGPTTTFSPGDDVTFTITVENQGSVDAQNILITDYIPAGLSLSPNDANGWVAAAPNATVTIPGPLAVGQQAMVDIVLQVDPIDPANPITDAINIAEISAAEDTNGGTPGDVDSTPDSDQTNDAGGEVNSPADDALNGDGTGTVPGTDAATDEDDHDPEDITIAAFDLALTKIIDPASPGATSPVYAGDDVTFIIEVFNQSGIDAANIQIVDYIPAGFTLSASDTNGWGDQAGNLTPGSAGPVFLTLPGPLAGNSSTCKCRRYEWKCSN